MPQQRSHTGRSPGKGASAPRRDASTRGLLAASACAKDALRSAAGKRGIAESRLITHWTEIAGDKIASASRPVRVKTPRGMAMGGVLVLAVEGARASEVEHAIPQVIEKVNAYYGYGAVSDVKLTQAVGDAVSLKEPPQRPRSVRPEELPKEKKQELDALTKPIASDALRDALQTLGANIMAKSEGTSSARASKAGAASRGVVRSLSAQARERIVKPAKSSK